MFLIGSSVFSSPICQIQQSLIWVDVILSSFGKQFDSLVPWMHAVHCVALYFCQPPFHLLDYYSLGF